MGEFFYGAILVLFIIACSIAGSTAILKYVDANKECKQNSDCASTRYCGSDFVCHEYPNITQTIVTNDYTKAAAVIGLSIILAALIIRKRQNTYR
ncbi:hypothetical protein HY489_00775 [Candidatus Woesearchaeota archaeon]|nr:hypothetical protein [Candidatus Woesearchaeota archaeon]